MLSIIRRYLPYLSLFHLVHLFGLEKKMAAQYKTDQTIFDSDLTVPVAGTVFYLLLVTVGPKIMEVSQAKRERRRTRPPFLPKRGVGQPACLRLEAARAEPRC